MIPTRNAPRAVSWRGMAGRRLRRYFWWIPPVVLGLTAACVPILPAGDYRADDYGRLRWCLLGLAFLYIPLALVARAARRGRRLCERDARANRAAAGLCARCGYPV